MSENFQKIISLGHHRNLRTVEAAERVQFAVRPLFRVTRRGEPMFIGSSVLVRVGTEHFLFSAAHVFDEPTEEAIPHGVLGGVMMTFGSEKHVELRGLLHATKMPASGRRLDDRIDVAVLEISADEANEIDDGKFLTPDDLDIRDEEAPRHPYLVLGFPDSKQKRDLTASVYRLNFLPYQGYEADSENYGTVGVSRGSHLLVYFDKKDAVGAGGRDVTPPSPDGISGGGFWRIDDQVRPVSEATNMKLVAIMIEHRERKAKALIATRIKSHIELLHKVRPDLKSQLPSITWTSMLDEVSSDSIPPGAT